MTITAEQSITDLYRRIAQSIAGELPAGWTRAVIEARLITGITELEAYYFSADTGTTPQSVYAGDDADPAFETIRELMGDANGEKGAWFTAKFELDASGKYKIDYDYEAKPVFAVEPEAKRFAADLERFPRAPALVPRWMPRA